MSVEGAVLTKGSVGRHLFNQTLPMVVGILALMSVGLLDAYFIGNLGKDPLTAVSFIFPVVFALSSLGVGVIAAIASVVSRALGSGQMHKAQSLVALGIFAAGLFGIVITVLLLLFKRPLFELMNASPNLLPLIDSYMTPFAFGFPMLLINMGGNGALRAQGMAGKASLILMVMALVNLVLDPILIAGMGSFEGFGVQGAAYATVAGWTLASVLALVLIARSPVGLHFSRIQEAHPGEDLRALIRVGAPAAVSNSVNPLGLSIMTALLAKYGDAAVAGFGAGGRLQALAVVPLLALSSSIGGIVGQNWGAGYGDRARRALWMAIGFCVVYSLSAGILMVAWRDSLASVFTDSPLVIEAISTYLLISVWGYAGFGALIVVNGAFNAIDRAYWALAQSVIRVALIMIPVAVGLSMILESRSIYAAELIANLVGGLIAIVLGRALLDDRWLAR
ncbi:MAG: MATE family efflux transporter [Pseudomonadota bacterium]|nr:MATE family efflux transporter [Pseudomonadota bacterium]